MKSVLPQIIRVDAAKEETADQDVGTRRTNCPPRSAARNADAKGHGMSIDLSPPEHEHTAMIGEAALWLSMQSPAPSPVVPALRRRFGLSAKDACVALREAAIIRRRAM